MMTRKNTENHGLPQSNFKFSPKDIGIIKRGVECTGAERRTGPSVRSEDARRMTKKETNHNSLPLLDQTLWVTQGAQRSGLRSKILHFSPQIFFDAPNILRDHLVQQMLCESNMLARRRQSAGVQCGQTARNLLIILYKTSDTLRRDVNCGHQVQDSSSSVNRVSKDTTSLSIAKPLDNMAVSPTPKKSLRIGVMMDNVQLVDIMGIDLFGNMSRKVLEFIKSDAPPELAPLFAAIGVEEHALDIEFFYLAPTLEPTPVTLGLSYMPNMTYDDCPRDLDIVLIGGPLLSHRPPQADKFMKEAWYVLLAALLIVGHLLLSGAFDRWKEICSANGQ